MAKYGAARSGLIFSATFEAYKIFDESMISHQYKCIFIHIPKCAGTSIEKALGHLDGHHGRWGQDHRTITEIEQSMSLASLQSFRSYANSALRKLHIKKPLKSNPKNQYVVTKAQYEHYFKFTIVRNPWARAYSWYNNIMRDDKKKSGIGVFGNPTFASFLREQIGKSALRPQTYWLRSLDGEIKLNFIGRFENLRNDFEKACQSMNVGNIELPHEIRSGDENYVSFYDTESANLIYNAYKEEIDLFGYNFES